MTVPVLSGPGRFETLADDGERFHLRQSSLTEKTLLGYMLTCLALATCLLVMGAQLVYQPRSSWLVLLVMPVGALWLLRYNGEVIADRQRRIVHVKVRRLGFWEGARAVAFDDIGAVIAVGAGRSATVSLRTPAGDVVIANRIHGGAARRLATKIAVSLGQTPVLEGVWGATPDETSESKASSLKPQASSLALREEAIDGGFRVTYPTRSYGTAAVLYVCSTLFGALAAVFLSWAARILYVGPVTFTRAMLVATPSALLGLCTMLFYSAVCLSIGDEVITVTQDELEARTLLAGRRAGFLRVLLEELKEVRVTSGIKLLWEGGARHVAATLPAADQEWLCAKIREKWQARLEKVPATSMTD